MVNAQQWLDTVYPAQQRLGITEIYDVNKALEGELKMVGFDRLTKLNLSHNKLTKLEVDSPALLFLNVESNPDLATIYCPIGVETILKDQSTTIHYIPSKLEQVQTRIQELETEVATHLQALQTGQEWSERQGREIQDLQNNLQTATQALEADTQELPRTKNPTNYRAKTNQSFNSFSQ